MFMPYLSLDVLKSQRSHVPHLWGIHTNMGCKPKCGYHSLSSIAFSLFSHSNFLLLISRTISFRPVYCKFGVGSFIAADADSHKHSASFSKRSTPAWLRYTLKMLLHLRTYSFFPIRFAALLSSSCSFSCWNNTIQKKIASCLCLYTISLLFFNIIIHFMVSSKYKIYALLSCRRKDGNLKTKGKKEHALTPT